MTVTVTGNYCSWKMCVLVLFKSVVLYDIHTSCPTKTKCSKLDFHDYGTIGRHPWIVVLVFSICNANSLFALIVYFVGYSKQSLHLVLARISLKDSLIKQCCYSFRPFGFPNDLTTPTPFP